MDQVVKYLVDVQCDYATGLSRSMAGRVLPSERPEHVIYESQSLRLVLKRS